MSIKAGDAKKLFIQNKDHYLSTLEDFLIFERKNLNDTGKNLSDYKKNSGVWLSGTKSGARFVHSYWDPDAGKLFVNARDADYSYSYLGCRPSRYFV